MFQNLQGSQLLIEPLVGYRCFQVRSDGALFSMNNVIWPADGLQATCTVHVKAPDKYCGCGIYASKKMEWLMKQDVYWPKPTDKASTYSAMKIVAGIHLWGTVQQYTEGYRAEWAKPVVLYYLPNTFELAKLAAQRYGAITHPRPDVKREPDAEDLEYQRQQALRKQQLADERKRAYLKKREQQQKMLAEAMRRGLVDSKGNLTQAGKLWYQQKGGTP